MNDLNSFIGWIGGKRALRKVILAKFPSNIGRYIEVFGGAGWVLFGKDAVPNQLEVFNDADGQLINLYRCVKYHPQAVSDALALMPTSRELFFDAKEQLTTRGLTDIQRAARSLYAIKTSFGSGRKNFATRPKSIDNTRDYLVTVQARLRNVIIENMSYRQLIPLYDKADALFYCDPPYVGTEKHYDVPFGLQEHEELAQILKGIKGRFVLSYNDAPLVRELYSWAHIDTATRPNTLAGNSKNTDSYHEVIITNF